MTTEDQKKDYELGGKTVKNVCFLNTFGELVGYELVGPRGGILQAIRYPNSNKYYLRNKFGSIVALHGNYTLTDVTGVLRYIDLARPYGV